MGEPQDRYFAILKAYAASKEQARNYDEFLKRKRLAGIKAKRDARVQSMRWVQLTCAECGNCTVVSTKDVPEAVCQKCACHYATSLDCFAD